jgi:hypothetical protein
MSKFTFSKGFYLSRIQPARKKSKSEVMAEVMAKSKEHKVVLVSV